MLLKDIKPNRERIRDVFCKVLKVPESTYQKDLGVDEIPAWDSIGHLNLLQAIEKEFNIAFDIDDAIDIETIDDVEQNVEKYLEGNQ